MTYVPNRKQKTPAIKKSDITLDIRDRLSRFVAGELMNIDNLMEQLDPKDRLKFITDVLKYITPAMKAVDTSITGDVKNVIISYKED